MKRVALVLLVASFVVPAAACQGRRMTLDGPPPMAYESAPAMMPGVGPQGPGAPVANVPPGAMGPGTMGPMGPGPMGPMGPGAPMAPGAMPPAAADAESRGLVGEAAGQERVAREEQQFLVRSHLERARAALSANDVEGAKGWYGRALDLDPSNREAIEGMRNLSDDRTATVGTFLEEQRTAERVRREQAAAEVRNHLERGRTLEGQEQYAAAVAEYQRALAILAWYTDTAEFGTSADRVRDLIENAEYKARIAERVTREEQIRAAQVEREQDLAADRERRLGRIRAYFEQANLAFRRGEYALAREYARAALREDPGNPDATALVQISFDAEHQSNQVQSKQLFDEQWRAVILDLERSALPQVTTVEFPADWLDGIAQRTPRVIGDIDTPEDTGTTAAVLAALESKRVQNITWEQANLDQVVAYLRTVTGLNFFITPKVRAEKMEEVAVDFAGTDVTVKTLLDIVTEPAGLKWEVRGGVVTIAAADEISGTMRLRYFDVKDLGVAIQNFVGTDINLIPSNFTPPEPPELPEPQPIFQAEALVELVKETVGGTDAWNDPATIETRNGIIIARNRSELLDQVQRLLDELRANSGLLVRLEVRFLTAEDNFLRDVGVDIRGLGDDSQGIGAPGLGTDAPNDDIFFGSPADPDGSPLGIIPEPSSSGTSPESGIFYNDGQDGAYQARVENLFDILLGNPEVLTGTGGLSFQHTFLDDTQIEVILRAVEKSERIQQITAPTLTVYNSQRANVQVLNQISYVQDYDVEIAQASNIANPIIQTIQDGVILDVRPTVAANRRFVMLELRPTVALLTRPIATFSTSLASGPFAAAPVVIQIPELRVSRVRTTVSMPDGGTLLLGGLKFYEQENIKSGVPFLSDVPILSFLLSRQGNYVNRRNLIILISAEIVPLEEREPKGQLAVPPIPAAAIEVPVRPAPYPCEPVGDACAPCAPPPSACVPSHDVAPRVVR